MVSHHMEDNQADMVNQLDMDSNHTSSMDNHHKVTHMQVKVDMAKVMEDILNTHSSHHKDTTHIKDTDNNQSESINEYTY